MINELLSKRNLPGLLTFADGSAVQNAEDWQARRHEIKNLIQSEGYGFLPPPPKGMRIEELDTEDRFCAGKVTLTKVLLTAEMENGEYAFPVYCAVPNTGRAFPAFIHINFRDDVPDRYMPTEELCDNGFAVFSFCYKDAAPDDGDFSGGLAGLVLDGQKRAESDPGKIALWSWSAMRVMDYIQTLDAVDKKNIAVIGHSRLGKTALFTGALDERFAFTVSNNSGCGGAAITRDKQGESITRICQNLWYWFCEKYKSYADDAARLPFDQHFMLAAIAPRRVYVASAKEDIWADPVSEYLACAGASEAYEFLGEQGFVCPDRLPVAGESFHEGKIGYHMRAGTHYLGREDWLKVMEYIKRHINK
ncbi:MAG: hypothetical protein FWF05_02980 [Oscillospiraceae bacterium]|nr:hypothetical protein [Oscillospiraceae bacterium]